MQPDDNTKKTLIVDLADIFEHKKRKEEELEFYQKELVKLYLRMSMVKSEISVTETIINMIENEQVVDLREMIMKKRFDK